MRPRRGRTVALGCGVLLLLLEAPKKGWEEGGTGNLPANPPPPEGSLNTVSSSPAAGRPDTCIPGVDGSTEGGKGDHSPNAIGRSPRTEQNRNEKRERERERERENRTEQNRRGENRTEEKGRGEKRREEERREERRGEERRGEERRGEERRGEERRGEERREEDHSSGTLSRREKPPQVIGALRGGGGPSEKGR